MKKIYLFCCMALGFNAISQNDSFNYVQMMHNSADTSIKHLKLWINDTVWVSQFDYLTCTPQVKLDTGIHIIGVSMPGATSQSQCISQATLNNVSNTQGAYSFAFLAVVGIHDPGSQYNPGSSQKPFGIYTYTDSPLLGEPSPMDCRIYVSHLSTDISSITIVSSNNITFANNLDYKSSTANYLFNAAGLTGGTVIYTVTVSSPSGSLGVASFSAVGGKKTCLVTTGFNDTLINARVTSGGGKKLVLGLLPLNGGAVQEIKLQPMNASGLPKINAVNEWGIGPNPADDELHIFSPVQNDIAYSICDLCGRILMSGSLTNDKTFVNTSSLPAGLYFIQCTNAGNSRIEKFIVEH